MTRKYFDFEMRKQLEKMYESGESLKEIAEFLSVSLGTIYREINRGCVDKIDKNGRFAYSALLSQKKFCESLKRRGKKRND